MRFYISIITMILWPIIPVFWIITHGFPKFVKKLQSYVYPFSFMVYMPFALLIYIYRDIILSVSLQLSESLRYIGIALFIIGILLHIWTIKLLGFYGITGKPEVLQDKNMKLVFKGPFCIIRHPTYLAHTLILIGIFMFTGYLALLILSILDFMIVSVIIIPLEERELLERFGDDYKRYVKNVKRKIIPYIF